MERQTRIEKSRALIFQAAEDVFRETGYENASVGTIAARAGLTRKTVYNLFKSKEDLAREVIHRAEAQAEPLYRHAIEAEYPAFDLLERILLDSAGWCRANPGLAKLALVPRDRPVNAPPDGRASFQRIVRDTLVLGQQQGVIRTDEDADVLALILLGIYGQAMLSVIAGVAYGDDDIRRLIRLVVEGIGVSGAR